MVSMLPDHLCRYPCWGVAPGGRAQPGGMMKQGSNKGGGDNRNRDMRHGHETGEKGMMDNVEDAGDGVTSFNTLPM